ncbi:MAG: DUF4340 domain-containing protein [Deltaproteobacteria bacterium]|nr:DUF4340 domain-containing protein [Deltaproteobacteria bacterium]
MKLKNNLILLIILIVFAALVLFIEKPFENKSKKIRQEAAPLFPELQVEKVKKLQVKKSDDTTITLKSRDNVWYIIDREEYPADPQVVEGAIRKLQGLKKINLISRKKDKLALFEVKEGMGMEVMLFGPEDKKMAHLFIGKSGPDLFSTYIRRAESDEVFLYEEYLKGNFDRQVNNWRDRTIFNFNANEATELRMVQKKETIVLSKDTKGNWHIEEPISSLGENMEVDRILNTLAGLKAADFADEEELRESRVHEPEYQITVKLKDNRKKTLFIGNKKGEHQYFAKNDEKKYLYLLSKSIVENLTPSVKDLEKVEIEPEEKDEKPSVKKEASPKTPPRRS